MWNISVASSAFLENKSIPDLLTACPHFVDGMNCLITCADSTRDVRAALREVLPRGKVQFHGRFVVLSAGSLYDLKDDILSGFDVVYFFSDATWRRTDASLWAQSFSTERTPFSEGAPEQLTEIIVKSGAERYASDGVGLNILAGSADLIDRAIMALSARSGTN